MGTEVLVDVLFLIPAKKKKDVLFLILMCVNYPTIGRQFLDKVLPPSL
jgi:hypothetical protein